MFQYVSVGGVVVGTFADARGKAKILRLVAPGCNPQIKKGYKPHRPVPQSKRTQREARQQKPRVGNYERIVYLKPGEFKL